MAKKTNENKNHTRLIALGLVIALIVLIIVVFSTMFEEKTIEYDMKVSVVENATLGISTDDFELNFGRIPIDGRVTKFISLNYDGNAPSKVNIQVSGNMAPFITLEKNNFMIEKQEKFGLYIKGTEYGNFTGKLVIKIIAPKNQLSRLTLSLV